MDLYASNQYVEQLELTLRLAEAGSKCEQTLELAWHLRQRDSQRALNLLDRLEQASTDAGETCLSKTQRLRGDMIRAEILWLHGELEQAEQLLQTMLQDPDICDDKESYGDTHRLLSYVYYDQGRHIECDIEMAIAIDESSKSEDFVRSRCSAAGLARMALMRDRRVAKAYFDRHFDMRGGALEFSCGLDALVYDFEGIYHGLDGDYHLAVEWLSKAYTAAVCSGMLRRAIVNAASIGFSYASMNQMESALDWLQTALSLAKRCGWPPSIGHCLTQLGETLRRMGSFEAAQTTLNEALENMQGLTHSRNYALAVCCMADLAFDRNDYLLAKNLYKQLEGLPGSQEQRDLLEQAELGQRRCEEKILEEAAAVVCTST